MNKESLKKFLDNQGLELNPDGKTTRFAAPTCDLVRMPEILSVGTKIYHPLIFVMYPEQDPDIVNRILRGAVSDPKIDMKIHSFVNLDSLTPELRQHVKSCLENRKLQNRTIKDE